MMNMTPLRVAIIGLGTVGTGVAKILLEHPDRMIRQTGRPIELKKAIVRDLSRPRDITLPESVLSDNIQSVIEDDEIDLAIQLMGGIDPAREIMLSLLKAGKNVVTANKALLCEHGDEIFQEARKQNGCIAFEAAVAGGIPIIHALSQSMTANQIVSIEAILNGTSNFILTEMLDKKRSYEDVLKQAQELGYAEADPTMDVDGTDAAQKLVILTQLAFGTKVNLDQFTRSGIDNLNLEDLEYANELGYKIKLLAVSKLINNELELHVQPTLVKKERPLAAVDGAFNMVAMEGDAVGKTWYSGAGAGQMPTASAVVSDIIDIAIGRAQLGFNQLDLWQKQKPLPVCASDNITSRYYLRFHIEDKPHVFADIAAILGNNGISLASIIQHESSEENVASENSSAVQVPLVVMTHRTSRGNLISADKELEKLSSISAQRICLPVAD
jgi:homoserine dehydrogenase